MSDKTTETKTLINKNFPTEHLNAGKPNPHNPKESSETKVILGDMTRYPKPITNDKAWKAK